jgi:hypothetical protein
MALLAPPHEVQVRGETSLEEAVREVKAIGVHHGPDRNRTDNGDRLWHRCLAGSPLSQGPHAVLANILVAVTIIHVVLNLKQLKTLVRRRSITIEARFRGSADSAQRGYAAGAAAALTEGSVEVRFRQPVPLDRDLLTEAVSDEEIGVFSGSDLVMEVNQSDELSIDIPVDDDVIDAIFARGAVVSHDGQEHDHCFGCSLTRSDGLGIATRPVGATGVWGTTWTPDQSLPSTDGFVNDEIVWAALDCPGSFAASEPSNETSAHPKVPSLRAMTVQIREHVRVGEPFAILGWRVDRSDEAVECGVAIVDKARHVKAYAHLSYTSSRAPTSTIER